jgi:hypothetical protein
MAESNLLGRLVLANPPRVGLHAAPDWSPNRWSTAAVAYAASAALDISGEVALMARLRLQSGAMTVGF